MGLLSAKIGQVTGWLGLGSGIPVLVGEAEPPGLAPEPLPHASSSDPMLPSSSPAPALRCRNPRLVSWGRDGVPSACQPSLGCIPITSFVDVRPPDHRGAAVSV